MTRAGCAGDVVAVVGRSYILNAFDAENTQSVRPSGVRHNEWIVEVSCSTLQYMLTVNNEHTYARKATYLCVVVQVGEDSLV